MVSHKTAQARKIRYLTKKDKIQLQCSILKNKMPVSPPCWNPKWSATQLTPTAAITKQQYLQQWTMMPPWIYRQPITPKLSDITNGDSQCNTPNKLWHQHPNILQVLEDYCKETKHHKFTSQQNHTTDKNLWPHPAITVLLEVVEQWHQQDVMDGTSIAIDCSSWLTNSL